MPPAVYIVAGPNGAGKTTFAREFLAHYVQCPHFLNADDIAREISAPAPELVAVRALRQTLQEIERLAQCQEDFGFESTLSGLTFLNLTRRLRSRGYLVNLFFLWVRDVELGLARIRSRVATGGHDVPEMTVRRRYGRSIANFLRRYRHEADSWFLFDNSEETPVMIACSERGQLRIIQPEILVRVEESALGR